ALVLEDRASGRSHELRGLEVGTDLRMPAGTPAALDVDKLRRAVGNIAANARDAMGGRGRLHVEAWVEAGERTNGLAADRLVLVVSDEGPGVAESIRERVFEPFTTFGQKTGTGLGLAVAGRLVED